jgi:hypothetical protein
MLDPVRPVSGFLDANPGDRTEPAGLTQADIDALPSIMGAVSDPAGDSTARMDKAGYVYLWEPGDNGIGFWVQAGYVRNGRQRFGQVIDPNDIKWFELAAYKKKVLRAKKSLSAVRLPSRDDIWDVTSGDVTSGDVTSEAERRETLVQRWTGEGDSNGGAYGAPNDADSDMI